MPEQPVLRAQSRAQLSAANVSIERGGQQVLDDVSVSVTPGTRLGIVGENGRGKSTLLHILVGRLTPDAGSVTQVGSIGIAEQEIAVVAKPPESLRTAHRNGGQTAVISSGDGDRAVGQLIDLELADVRAVMSELDMAGAALAAGDEGADERYAAALDVATALDAWDADRRVDIALAELGAVEDRDRRLLQMSVGERYRVRLACLLGANHDFLVLDEPTNHLDRQGLDFLTASLRAASGGGVIVSHDRKLLSDVATRILDLDPSRDGRPRLYGDGYAGYLAGREAEMTRWAQEYEQHQAEHARLADDLSTAQNRLQSGWKPPKGTGKHTRATRAPSLVRNVNRRIEDLDAHEVTKPEPPLRFAMPELPVSAGRTLIRADDVSVIDRLTTPVSLAISSGDRLLITGPNGVGKSTLLAALAGRLRPDTGAVTVASGTRLGVVAQESPSADPRPVRVVFEEHKEQLRDTTLAHVSLSSMGLMSSRDMNRPVADLSMGQQRRLDLALALAGRPHIVLLDEPTNHLSMRLVDELTDALDATAAAVVLVTHDRQLRADLEHWPELPMT